MRKNPACSTVWHSGQFVSLLIGRGLRLPGFAAFNETFAGEEAIAEIPKSVVPGT